MGNETTIFAGILVFSIIITFAVCIGMMFLMGHLTNVVLRNRGYYDNWFWWGFFCGIAPIIAAFILPDKSEKAKKE